MIMYEGSSTKLKKHSKQATGFSTTNPNIRVDTLSHQIALPQKAFILDNDFWWSR